MGTITTKDGTTIYDKDCGTGRPIVFSHGLVAERGGLGITEVFPGLARYRCIAPDHPVVSRLMNRADKPITRL